MNTSSTLGFVPLRASWNQARNIFSVLILSAAALLGQADANKGQIVGTVYDSRQAVVPDASVTIRNVGTGLTRDLKTNASGGYRAVQLDPGQYQIVAQSAGFAATTLDGITVNVGSAVGVDITLQVQATSVTVDVAESMVNVALPAPTTVLNSAALTNLPINGRRFQDFAVLTPTVIVEPSRSQLSFAGQRGVNSNVMVDGADYNQPFFGGIRGGERSNSILTVPQSSVQEFQAITTGYSAEYGRSTGGILNVISKAGTNEFHGEGFYQNRNSSLSKDGPIPVPDLDHPGTLINVQPAESLQQWGGAIGGPIKKDKLFFFVAYEQQHSTQPRRVVFSSLVGFTPTAANTPAYNFYKGQEQPFNKVNNAGTGTIKGDYVFKNGSRLTMRYNRSGSDEGNAVTVGGAIEAFTTNALNSEGTEIDRLHFGSVQHTAVITPSILNDLRFSGSYEERPRLSNSSQPGIVATTIGTYGSRNFLPTTQYDRRIQITDGVTIIHGAHSFKFGTDINKLRTGQTFGFDQFGTFTISSSNVGQILDLLSGAGSVSHRFDSSVASYSRQIGNLKVDYGATQAALFAQDSFRVLPKLTLDFGFRWEGQWNPSVDSSNTTLVSKISGFVFPNGARADVTRIPNAIGQVMPRFGFAWSPTTNGKFVLRGHTGIFYAATPLLIYSDPTGNFRTPPNNVRLFLNNTARGTVYQQFLAAGVNLDQYAPDKIPVFALEAVQNAASFGLGTAPDPFAGAATTAVATDFLNPRSFQTGLGFDYRLTNRLVTGVQLNYVNTVHLERNKDYNLPLPIVQDSSQRPVFCIASCTPSRTRPISSLGQINVRESSSRSMYRGMTISTQYQGSKFQAGVYYSLSQNHSDDDNERDSGGQAAMNSFNYKQDYGYSNLDARHVFSTYALYKLPMGIEVSGLFRARSGLPLNPRTGADTNGDGASTDRALQSPGVPFERNSFRNRAVYGDDLRLMKSFNLMSETRKLQLSVEFFNLLNLDNVIFAGTANIYGLGVSTTGQTLTPDARWLVLKTADGKYSTQNQQVGFPLQVQFGARFFF